MVQPAGEPDAEGRLTYRLTDAGHAEIAGWFSSPVDSSDRPRDELAIKVALALTTPGVDVRAVLQTQRTATLRNSRSSPGSRVMPTTKRTPRGCWCWTR